MTPGGKSLALYCLHPLSPTCERAESTKRLVRAQPYCLSQHTRPDVRRHRRGNVLAPMEALEYEWTRRDGTPPKPNQSKVSEWWIGMAYDRLAALALDQREAFACPAWTKLAPRNRKVCLASRRSQGPLGLRGSQLHYWLGCLSWNSILCLGVFDRSM